MNGIAKIIIWMTFFFITVPVTYAVMDFNLPEGTKFLIYVKDIRNLEDNLRKSGILNLSPDYFDFLVQYLKEEQPALEFYRSLKSMDDGNFIKTLIGELAVVNLMNENLAVLRMQKGSAYFTKLMDTFNIKGSFNGYYVDFSGDQVLLCRNRAVISFYKNAAGKKPDDPVLNYQIAKDREPDILYYRSGDTLIHPWIDSLIAKGRGKKSLSIGLNFQKKSIAVYSSPGIYSVTGLRTRFPGQTVQSTALAFIDSAQNPYEFFQKIFGEDALGSYENGFRENFENQTSIALTGFTPDIVPSFLIAARPKGGKSIEAEKTLNAYLTSSLGETNWVKQTVNGLTVKYGNTTGLYSYLIAGLYVVSDSREAVSASADVFSGKIPSVWENKDNAKLKDLMEKPAAIYLNIADIADGVYKSMLKKMTLTGQQKEDLRIYMDSIKGMGSLVGYSEDKKDYSYFYFVLKGK